MGRGSNPIDSAQIFSGGWTPRQSDDKEHAVLITGYDYTPEVHRLDTRADVRDELRAFCRETGRPIPEGIGRALPYVVAAGLSKHEAARLETRLRKSGALVSVEVGKPQLGEEVYLALEHPRGAYDGTDEWLTSTQITRVATKLRFAYCPPLRFYDVIRTLRDAPCVIEHALQRAQAETLAAELREHGWSVELRRT